MTKLNLFNYFQRKLFLLQTLILHKVTGEQAVEAIS